MNLEEWMRFRHAIELVPEYMRHVAENNGSIAWARAEIERETGVDWAESISEFENIRYLRAIKDYAEKEITQLAKRLWDIRQEKE